MLDVSGQKSGFAITAFPDPALMWIGDALGQCGIKNGAFVGGNGGGPFFEIDGVHISSPDSN